MSYLFFCCIKRWIYLATMSTWRNVKLRLDYQQVVYICHIFSNWGAAEIRRTILNYNKYIQILTHFNVQVIIINITIVINNNNINNNNNKNNNNTNNNNSNTNILLLLLLLLYCYY